MKTLKHNLQMMILYFVSCVFCSCSIIAAVNGVKKNPKPQSITQIEKAAAKHELNDFPHYAVSPDVLDSIYKSELESFNSFFAFNQQGQLLVPPERQGCNIENTINEGISAYLQDWSVNEDYTINNLLQAAVSIPSKDTLVLDSIANYTVVLTWATYAGNYNKTTRDWGRELKRVASEDFDVLYLSLDMQDVWYDE